MRGYYFLDFAEALLDAPSDDANEVVEEVVERLVQEDVDAEEVDEERQSSSAQAGSSSHVDQPPADQQGSANAAGYF